MVIQYKGKIFQIKTDTVNSKIFEFAERAPGTRTILDNGKEILLTKEFRKEQNKIDYRLPGGKVFDTLDELNNFVGDILVKAKEGATKEVLQETGYEVQILDLLKISKCGATVIWDLYYFVSTKFIDTKTKHFDDDENIENIWVSYKKALEFCISGKVNEDRTNGILVQYLLNK